MRRRLTLLWFLLGLGSKLQVVASLSITEIVVLMIAPIVFVGNYRYMKRDGIMPFFILSLLVVFGCIIASVVNKVAMHYVLRGLAVTCIISSVIIVSHWILRMDPGGFKWFFLALPLSAIISTFYFKASVEVAGLGESAEEIMSGPIYWISRLRPLVMAPTKGWYLQMPWFVNLLAPLFMAAFSILTTTSGRSAALGSIGFALFVLIGGHKRKHMSRISRHFWAFGFLAMVSVAASYFAYKFTASKGWLGEDARRKYEVQTHGGQGGIGRLILGGRAESIIGLFACRDKPIVGWGPWAMDERGYTEEFFRHFGTWEDVESYVKLREWQAKCGFSERMLSCHSYITQFWAWYGIWGLVFWLYVIFAFLRYLKQDVAAVPQWYAWLACSIPTVFWGIFFSPLSDRVGVPLMVVGCLMARAVRLGRMTLPPHMLNEIRRVEARQ